MTQCLEHAAFETERLLHRNHSSAVGRRSRRQSAASAGNMSRASSVIQCATSSNVASEVRFTPIPPDKAELGSASPNHLDAVVDRRRGTPAPEPRESADVQPTSPDHARSISDAEPGSHPGAEPSRVESTTSRFIRKKSVTGSKPTEDETAIDQPAPGVDDAAQKERGSAQPAAATAKKTYCVNVSGAAVPAQQRNKKNATQTPYVGAAAIKAERKTKVFIAFRATRINNQCFFWKKIGDGTLGKG